ncbi:Uncharacterised protein [Mycobacteroides abscessus subsp. abscessus]|nr:Uncharacterised protein [Mycobacteroides abscessus subsp. abscessus]
MVNRYGNEACSSARPMGLVMLCTIATPGSRTRLFDTRSREMKSAELRMSWSDSTMSISVNSLLGGKWRSAAAKPCLAGASGGWYARSS